MVDSLTDELAGRSPIVIAGDFNAWAVEWGSRFTNPRGQNLLKALARLNVDLANVGTTSTYRRDNRESIIDITFCSPGLSANTNWRVHEGYTHSDHLMVRYCINYKPPIQTRLSKANVRQWKTAYFNKEVFVEALAREQNLLNLRPEALTTALSRACDTTMPRKLEPRNGRRPAYWWNAVIEKLRATCLKARRRLQRARTDIGREELRPALKSPKSALKKAIKHSKRACFHSLCQEANGNPWGDAYRIVMAKTKGAATPTERCPDKLKTIIDGLFPQHVPTIWPPAPYGDVTIREVARVTNDELLAAAKSLKPKKAAGPDGIPNLVLRVAVLENPDMFRTTLQMCMDEAKFPNQWKLQKLVLLPKPGKPLGDPSAYRPICLLDTIGKLLERIILNRLTEYTEHENGLSSMQFGFRKGRSTVDAIRMVIEAANKAKTQQKRGKHFCAVVTLDVKNALNSASWEAITSSLHSLRVPEYLCRMLKSYFENRWLMYETEVGQKRLLITAGVPQGSILGPALWNAMYNGVLRLNLPTGVQLIGFADDLVILVTGETREEVEVLATEAISVIEDWMQDKKLSIAHQKTEVVIISNRKATQQMEITVGECSITSQRSLKYLGVMIDDRLSFNYHFDYICKKAAKAITALTRIMPNNSAITSSRRRLLASVITSILRYGCPAWISALKTTRNQRRLNSTHRLMSLRAASAYRIVSFEAVCIIAGLTPICILLEEDAECYNQKGTQGSAKERVPN